MRNASSMGETNSSDNKRILEEVDNTRSIKMILHCKIRTWCCENGPIYRDFQGSFLGWGRVGGWWWDECG